MLCVPQPESPMRALCLSLALLILPAVAEARSAWTSGTFVYADLCRDPATGGTAGRRIVLRRSPNGDGVTYQAASGSLGASVDAEGLSLDDATRDIAFSVETAQGPIRFRGSAGSDVLAGVLSRDGSDEPLRLRRVLRSHEGEPCRPRPEDADTTASH